MGSSSLQQQLLNARNYFESGATRTYTFRKEQLKKLKAAIINNEQALHQALHTDLKKGPEESWVTETGFAIAEINAVLKNLHRWMQPEKVPTNLLNFPSSSYILREPMGIVLIVAPWNYPIQLLLAPLIGAMAAGNCAVLKPSEFASATATAIGNLIHEIFPPEYILYVEGDGASVIPDMMNNFRFDHIFYTGSTAVGKIIYQSAASKLVPVTLELGGKSPCVVEEDANIKVAARRIALTKFSNVGQMCVAPDYLLVHQSKKEELIQALRHTIPSFFSDNPATSNEYGRIINEKQFNRIRSYLTQGKIVHGGRFNAESLYIEPTILEDVSPDSPIMKEEIFGPVLPVLTFKSMLQAKEIILNNPNPLAFYVYTESKAREKAWLDAIPFGGGCVNNSSWQLTNHNLPFGGRGNSGIGDYHGKNSFEVFSHRKGILKTPTWFDPAIKYPPLKGKLKLFKWIVR